jgi:hypothetical protein
MDPHHFGKPDPHPHRSWIWIRIRNTVVGIDQHTLLKSSSRFGILYYVQREPTAAYITGVVFAIPFEGVVGLYIHIVLLITF